MCISHSLPYNCVHIVLPSHTYFLFLLAATAGADYGEVERSVDIPAHYTSGPLNNELTIPIRDDNLLEDLERFEVTLKMDDSRVLVGEPQVTTIWIEDNDRKCCHYVITCCLTSLHTHVSCNSVFCPHTSMIMCLVVT